MDGLSTAASVIAVIEISTKITSLCLQYATAVNHAKENIELFQRKVANLSGVLGEVKRLLDTHGIGRLPTAHKLEESLKDCRKRLTELEERLSLRTRKKSMHRVGFGALTWPFSSKEVREIVVDIQRYEDTFNLALQVDQT